jgi:uncharacterized membrane protein
MAALSYILLPVSGLFAFLKGSSERVRAHGAQALLLGLAWPLALYGASYVSSGLTRAVFAVGALAWMVLMVGAAFGVDLLLPAARRLAAMDER